VPAPIGAGTFSGHDDRCDRRLKTVAGDAVSAPTGVRERCSKPTFASTQLARRRARRSPTKSGSAPNHGTGRGCRRTVTATSRRWDTSARPTGADGCSELGKASMRPSEFLGPLPARLCNTLTERDARHDSDMTLTSSRIGWASGRRCRMTGNPRPDSGHGQQAWLRISYTKVPATGRGLTLDICAENVA
jgi:hypothetical protein